jgi:phage N-6-adenine-methyltransferase
MTKPSDERYTPEYILDVVREFSPIACDPCTTPDNRTKAGRFFTQQDNGLTRDWGGGLAWVNPPYSRGELVKWVDACTHNSAYHVLALIPSDLGSRAGQLAVGTCDAVCFVKGRIKFVFPNGEASAGSKQPSVIVYWGDDLDRFGQIFNKLGCIWRR